MANGCAYEDISRCDWANWEQAKKERREWERNTQRKSEVISHMKMKLSPQGPTMIRRKGFFKWVVVLSSL